jgi:tRNA-dihydrouridine synthase 1
MTEEKKEDLNPLPVDRQWIDKLLKRHPNPNSRIHDKALVVAPMVDQSDLAFRILCRRYGANLCFTPMIHTRLLLESESYREKFMVKLVEADRPLIAQVCGSDPAVVLQAARLLEPYVDGIDINCGCPQGIARRGNYGAFLLEKEDILLRLVNYLTPRLRVPLSIKVRLLPNPNLDDQDFDIPKASLALYAKLVDAGIHLLTIHGRTRKQKGPSTGRSDWETIRKAVDMFGDRIPIFANGSIEDFDDVEECLKVTNADGIMSSESLLEYPPIFYRIPQTPIRTVGRMQLSREYAELAKQYPPSKMGQGSKFKTIRTHIHRFLHTDMQEDYSLRKTIVGVVNMEELEDALNTCQQSHDANDHLVSSEKLSWYPRHTQSEEKRKEQSASDAVEEDGFHDPDQGCSLVFNDSGDGDY